MQIVMLSSDKSQRRNSQNAGHCPLVFKDIWIGVGEFNMFLHQESVNYPTNTENPKCAEIQNSNPFVTQVEMMKP